MPFPFCAAPPPCTCISPPDHLLVHLAFAPPNSACCQGLSGDYLLSRCAGQNLWIYTFETPACVDGGFAIYNIVAYFRYVSADLCYLFVLLPSEGAIDCSTSITEIDSAFGIKFDYEDGDGDFIVPGDCSTWSNLAMTIASYGGGTPCDGYAVTCTVSAA